MLKLKPEIPFASAHCMAMAERIQAFSERALLLSGYAVGHLVVGVFDPVLLAFAAVDVK